MALIVDQGTGALTTLFRDYVVTAQAQFSRPLGQEFRPQQTGLDTVELDLTSAVSGQSAMAYVNVRQGAIDGQVAGTSGLTEIPASSVSGPEPPPLQVISFRFPGVVPLAPGDTYVIELVPTNGRIGILLWGGDNLGDPYPDGRAIAGGVPWDAAATGLGAADFWFREGLSIPDPARTFAGEAIVALFLLGGVTVGGPGYAVLPGLGRVPVPPRGPLELREATREALRGLALAEIAGSLLTDPALRTRVEQIGLEAVRKALERWSGAAL